MLECFLFTDKIGDEYKKHFRDLYTNTKNPIISNFLDDISFTVPDYKVASIYAFMITSSFNGTWMRTAGYSGINSKGKMKLYSLINKLNNVYYQNKLRGITYIENLSFEDSISKWDSEDTYFYLDPPYFKFSKYYGAEDSFPDSAHRKLSDILKGSKSKWSLSYYYFPELEDWFPKDKYHWETKEFNRSSASFSNKKKGNELLIMNY